MPMSTYMRHLRDRVGTTLLEVPTVSVLTQDDAGRVLLVRHAEGGDWSTPGGMIEPYETPADAALREMWEETGLLVELTRVVGVFGGRPCTSVYSNGDQVAWVSTVFAAKPIRGVLEADGVEALEAKYVSRDEARSLRCKPHVPLFLDAYFSGGEAAQFQVPTWLPPSVRTTEGRESGGDATQRHARGEASCEVVVRAAEVGDAAAVAELLGELGYPADAAHAAERIRSLSGDSRGTVIVACVNGDVCGLASIHLLPLIHRDAMLARITGLVVKASDQGRGVGTSLLAAAEQFARSKGAERVEVTSGDNRVAAHAFYESRGFSREGTRLTKWSTE